jgi:hypothetical protein
MYKLWYYLRWTALLGAGGILLQAPSCTDIISTGLLAFIAGTTYFLARNV